MRVTRSKPVLAGIAAVFIFATAFSSLFSTVQAQTLSAFTSTDRFDIPELNGSIHFAFNGTYSSATLTNSTWYFSDLTLNTSQSLGDLEVSVQDSNITIFSSYAYSAASNSRQAVRYFAEGAGRQVFNLGVNGTTHPSEWWVTLTGISSVFLAEGKEWTLLPDNTVIVNGQTGNISVAHFNFGATRESNLPFIEQHSVALATVAVVAATLSVAALISVKVRKK